MKHYLIIDACDEWEQALGLVKNESTPPDGILDWTDGKAVKVALFPSRASARAAVTRTHHYAHAFGRTNLPQKQNCRINEAITTDG